jgi:hypothetical protein
MNLASRCTRIVALALTTAALAASPAWARPVDMPPAHTEASVPEHEHQDLRSADAIDAALTQRSPAGTCGRPTPPLSERSASRTRADRTPRRPSTPTQA